MVRYGFWTATVSNDKRLARLLIASSLIKEDIYIHKLL